MIYTILFVVFFVRLCGGTIVPEQYKDAERRDIICKHILETDFSPDIVSLVEIWSDEYKDKMIECVKSKYPYHQTFKKKNFIKIGNGLLLLSKFPLFDPLFVRYENLEGWDDMSQKGIGAVLVALNSTYNIRVFWTHTQAGSDCTTDRFKNLDQALLLTQHYYPNVPGVLVGDLNLSLNQTYNVEYEKFIAMFSDFEDSFGENPICYTPTVDPVTNSMAEKWCGSDCCVIRDDFLLYYPNNKMWETKESGVIHDWKCKVDDKDTVDCSDHYPIYVSLELNV